MTCHLETCAWVGNGLLLANDPVGLQVGVLLKGGPTSTRPAGPSTALKSVSILGTSTVAAASRHLRAASVVSVRAAAVSKSSALAAAQAGRAETSEDLHSHAVQTASESVEDEHSQSTEDVHGQTRFRVIDETVGFIESVLTYEALYANGELKRVHPYHPYAVPQPPVQGLTHRPIPRVQVRSRGCMMRSVTSTAQTRLRMVSASLLEVAAMRLPMRSSMQRCAQAARIPILGKVAHIR